MISNNFDSLQECFHTSIPDQIVAFLNEHQERARQAHEGQGVNISFGNEIFQIWTGGSQGNKWVLENEVLQIHIRTDKPGWNTSVRYLSQGLWQYGVDVMRQRARECIAQEFKFFPCPDSGRLVSLSMVHYCFDFYSPKYSNESQSLLVAENMCLTSGVKAGIVFTSKRVETLTIGMNRQGLQIQIYDKVKEIKDKAHKEWMYDVWAEDGFYPPDDEIRDVWRVELRFGKEFLKDRNIHTFEDFRPKLEQLCSEGLFRRRLVKQDISDEKKERWGLHPLWAELYYSIGRCDSYVPVGRKLTGARLRRIETLEKQIMGTARSLSVLKHNYYDREDTEKDAVRMCRDLLMDPEHYNKEAKAMLRYQWIDEAQ